MRLLDRTSQWATVDLDDLLDWTENPEATLQRLIHDMEDFIVELRREAVAAVARMNQVKAPLGAARARAGDVEREAARALERGNELLARQIVGRGIGTLKSRDALEAELAEASRLVSQLLRDVLRMEDRALVARRKWEELAAHRPVTDDGRLTAQPVGTATARRSGAVTTSSVSHGIRADRPSGPSFGSSDG